MGNRVQLKRSARAAGFTMAEVVLALAVVAFGLVAVLGVLPIGLNTNRDNRDETIIKHDVEFWMNAIRGGRLSMDALNHVEWVELKAGGVVYRSEYAALARDGNPDNPTFWPVFEDNNGKAALPPLAYRGTLKQAGWRKDVLGWMSVPDNLPSHGEVVKFAKIRPLGSTLMNRLQSIKAVADDGNVDYIHEAGDLTFTYLLETRINMVAENFWEIKLIARWPIIEEGTTADTVKTGHGKKTFVAYINAPLEKAWSRWDLARSERQVFDSLIPDETISTSALSAFHGADPDSPLDTPAIKRALDNLVTMGLAHAVGENSYTPGEMYDTFGRFSLRSPPGYVPFSDEEGNFIGFSPPDDYFPDMFFFKPALDDH
jgi:hypothetical protein